MSQQKPPQCILLQPQRRLRTHRPDLRMFCLAQCLRLLPSLLERLAHTREAVLQEVYPCQLMAPTGK